MGGFGSVSANEMNEVIKYNDRVVGVKEDISMRFQSNDDNYDSDGADKKHKNRNLSTKQLNVSKAKIGGGKQLQPIEESKEHRLDDSEIEEDDSDYSDDHQRKKRKHKKSRHQNRGDDDEDDNEEGGHHNN